MLGNQLYLPRSTYRGGVGDNPLNDYGAPHFLADFGRSQFRNNGGVVPSFTSLSGLTFTRALAAYGQTSAGALTLFGSGVPRITDKGLLIEGARTNKCTNYNAAPNGSLTNITKSGDAAATLTEVDDTAALATAGLSQICSSGKVFKLDNSAGGSAAYATFEGTTGNTNTHNFSLWARGSGTMRYGDNGGFASGTITLTSAFVRYSHADATVGSGAKMAVEAQAGAIVYFILNQLEEGGFVSSPIPVAGASVTRPADVCSIAVSGLAYPLTAFEEFEIPVLGASASQSFFAVNGPTTANRVLVYNNSTIPRLYVDSGGVNQANLNAGSISAGVVTRVAARVSTNSMQMAKLGTLGTEDTSCTVPAALTDVLLGQETTSVNQLFGYIKRVAIWPTAFSDANLQGVTS